MKFAEDSDTAEVTSMASSGGPTNSFAILAFAFSREQHQQQIPLPKQPSLQCTSLTAAIGNGETNILVEHPLAKPIEGTIIYISHVLVFIFPI